MNESTKFPSSFISSQFVKYIDEKEIKATVTALANTLSQKYEGQELVMIGVLKGSMTIMADLMRAMRNVKVYVDFVKLESHGRAKEHYGTISITKDITTDILDRNVLIVEEIIDTGRALNFLINRLKLSHPRNIELLTLFDKPYKRVVPIKTDYIGKQIDDQFVVGYGLDLEEFGRNFSEVYYLKFPN
jgi:hypoxanthine phosphoribosyltransferase